MTENEFRSLEKLLENKTIQVTDKTRVKVALHERFLKPKKLFKLVCDDIIKKRRAIGLSRHDTLTGKELNTSLISVAINKLVDTHANTDNIADKIYELSIKKDGNMSDKEKFLAIVITRDTFFQAANIAGEILEKNGYVKKVHTTEETK